MNKKIKDLVEDDKVLISFEKEDKHYPSKGTETN